MNTLRERRRRPTSRCARGRRWSDDPDIRAEVDHLLVDLSRQVFNLRDGTGWSQDATAAAAGVDKQTVLDIEKTRGDPKLSTLVRLAFIFGRRVRIQLLPV